MVTSQCNLDSEIVNWRPTQTPPGRPQNTKQVFRCTLDCLQYFLFSFTGSDGIAVTISYINTRYILAIGNNKTKQNKITRQRKKENRHPDEANPCAMTHCSNLKQHNQ